MMAPRPDLTDNNPNSVLMGAVGLERSIADITITPELWAREAHSPNIVGESAAMRHLADTMAADPSKTFQACVDLALDLCHADTCGISLRERTDEGEDVFRWIALAGQLKQHLHGTTPRYFPPCGLSVDSNAPLLMRLTRLNQVPIAIEAVERFERASPLSARSTGRCRRSEALRHVH